MYISPQEKEKKKKKKIFQSGLASTHSFQNTMCCFHIQVLKKLLGPTLGQQYRQATPKPVPFHTLSSWPSVRTVKGCSLNT